MVEEIIADLLCVRLEVPTKAMERNGMFWNMVLHSAVYI
jgi:hypothetical protein